MKVKLFMITFIVMFVLPNRYFAQWSHSFTTDQEYNSNPFRSRIAEETFINSANYQVGKDISIFSFSYNAGYYNFTADQNRNFFLHQLSVSAENENSDFGIFAEQRIGRDIYTYYNYSNISGYYSRQLNLDDYYLKLQPVISMSKYPNITILDNLKMSMNASLNHGFETGTTLIIGGAFTYKKYLSPTQSGIYSYLDENNQLVTESYIDKNISSLMQQLSFVRVAQSVASNTGIAFQFTNRSILRGIASFAKDINMIYGDESELFDDPVNYQGNNYSLELTHLLWDDITVKGSLSLNNKNYPSQGTYDESYTYNTYEMRADQQKIFNLSINKYFPLGNSESLKLNVGINYQWINNNSNSYLYNFSGNSLSLNLGIEF